jgi:CBS-domain-containing membrane protein
VNKLKFFALSFLILFQFACATYTPNNVMLGKTKVELIGLLGEPNRISKDGLFSRLDFQRGPAGMHTYFVYIDENDRVSNWRQVLTEENFTLIQVDMNKEQVVGLIGQTDIFKKLARNRGYV